MSFLNPFMLAGLTAVSVPIIIHLLNRRKFERVVWAAMRFLKISVEQNQRRIKIEDMILLACRCLLVALLALSLSRPVIRAATSMLGGEPKVSAVVVLDHSYSMSLSDGVESRFDAGKKAAEQAIKGLPAGSSVAVLLASDTVAPLIPSPTFDLTLAASVVRDAQIHDRPSNLLPAVREAVSILDGRRDVKKEIYVITDGQSSAWRQMNEIMALAEKHEKDIRCRFVFVTQPEERNLGITSARLDGGIAPINTPVRIEVRVKNWGQAEARDVNVRMAVNRDPPMDQVTIASIPPGEERGVSMFARFKAEGYHNVTARIDPDHLPADDTRSLTLRAVKQVSVLLVEGDSGREPRESETYFLRRALRPVPVAEREGYYIKPVVRTPTELESVVFEEFDAVIAANVTDFSKPVLIRLASYIKEGGSLMVFLGDNINRPFYNQQLGDEYGLLPARLGETRGDGKDPGTWFSLAERGYEHEIVSLWSDPAAGTLSSVKFFKAFDLLEHGSAAAGGDAQAEKSRVIARFADGKPAMVERNAGRGRVVLFASTADSEWSDMPGRAGVFVPLIHRALGYLVARQDEHLTLAVGQEFRHVAPMRLVNRDATIKKMARTYNTAAKDLNEVYEQRRIELANSVPVLQFAQTGFAGPYEVEIADAPPIRFSAQADPTESSLELLNEAQYGALEDKAHVVRWSSGVSLAEELERARVGTELWLALAAAVLVLAAAETLLAHWFSQSK